jgi:hypothetical protein
MVWARYTDNRGGNRAVKINLANYNMEGSGFQPFNALDPYMPARYCRAVRGYDPASGDTQYVYAGTKTAAIYQALDFTYPRLGNATNPTFQITGFVDESVPLPRGIINQ